MKKWLIGWTVFTLLVNGMLVAVSWVTVPPTTVGMGGLLVLLALPAFLSVTAVPLAVVASRLELVRCFAGVDERVGKWAYSYFHF